MNEDLAKVYDDLVSDIMKGYSNSIHSIVYQNEGVQYQVEAAYRIYRNRYLKHYRGRSRTDTKPLPKAYVAIFNLPPEKQPMLIDRLTQAFKIQEMLSIL